MIKIELEGREVYNRKTNKIKTLQPAVLLLEHSLVSVSAWEQKWHKPFLSADSRTTEESIDYVRCMATHPFDPDLLNLLTEDQYKSIISYITDVATATTISSTEKKNSKKIVTTEEIYWQMVALGIPFQPCETWHLNRLLMLITIGNIKNQPQKKMSQAEIYAQNRALNASRRAKNGG